MIPSQPRLSSNKENPTYASDFYSSDTNSSKPRISGIGRAPKRQNSLHCTKPYVRTRTTSIQRAKIRATRISKIKHRPPPLKAITSSKVVDGALKSQKRLRQPDRILQLPLRLPKPAIPSVDLVGSEIDSVVRYVNFLETDS